MTAWYSRGSTHLAARMDFDVPLGGKTLDVLRIVEMPMNGDARVTHSYVSRNEDIDYGVAGVSAARHRPSSAKACRRLRVRTSRCHAS